MDGWMERDGKGKEDGATPPPRSKGVARRVARRVIDNESPLSITPTQRDRLQASRLSITRVAFGAEPIRDVARDAAKKKPGRRS